MNRDTKPPQTAFEYALDELGVTLNGDARRPDEGLIASNYFVDTVEQGPLVVRVNELNPDAGDDPSFEARTLQYLTSRGMKVPRLMPFTDGTIEKHLSNQRILAYHPIEGSTLKAEDVDNPAVAESTGTLLAELIAADEQYSPAGDEPDGDVAFITKITDDFIREHPQFNDDAFFADAHTLLADTEFAHRLVGTPQGIVHADYFYENIVTREGELAGVIDFGDAYYGSVISDVAIGAMEFSVLEDSETWKPELFRAFLTPNAVWLREHAIDFDTFERVLLVNCIRFADYTLGFELEDNPQATAESNRYVQRFYRFRDGLHDQLQSAYNDTVK